MTDINALIDQAIVWLRQSRYAVGLTGAGISTPSGIPDFRSAASGMWDLVDPMEVASIYAFKKRPKSFYDWVRPHTRLILEAQPNPAHTALAQLEANGPLKCVITQNIDALHSRAGSRTVYEVHGHLRQATCLKCFDIFEAGSILADFIENGDVPRCPNCGGVLKPNIILFGELLPVSVMNMARQHVVACDMMVVAGSSLEVAPAGDLPRLAKRMGARLIIVNLEETHLDRLADLVIRGDVAEVLPRLAAPFVTT